MKAKTTIATALAVATLAGCGTGASIAGAVLQLAVNRPPEVPDAQKPPRDVTIRLHAAPTLNSGKGGPALALVARIYKLRQAEAFERLPYATFATFATHATHAGGAGAQADREALGPDLLEVKEVLLIPGQRYEVTEKVGREAGYVGVVALFRAPDGQRWRAAFPAADAEKGGITIGLHACALAVGQGTPARQQAVARPASQSQCA